MLGVTAHEFILVSLSLLTLILYHIALRYRLQKTPNRTSWGLAKRLRRAWVQMIMREKSDILAVQTLRNWVMAASFFASTSILISLGLLGIIFRGDNLLGMPQALDLLGSRDETLWVIKVVLLILDFFFAFFNFALSIRYYNHVNFMINLSPEEEDHVSLDTVSNTLNLGTLHYTLGMRAYYLAVPFTLWLFGPAPMFIGAVVIVLMLHKLDRTV